jgi:hypothetical protein
MVEPEEDDPLSEDEEAPDDDDDSEEGISKDKVEEEKVIRFRASAAQNAFWRVCVKGYHFFHPFSSSSCCLLLPF